MFDMSLIVEFVQEAREYIEEVEPILIELCENEDEAGGADAELVNTVFRLFHSMKGSAGFLALDTITKVTHEAETVLDSVRKGELSLNVEITAVLCKAIDLFHEMLNHIEETGNDVGFDEQAALICKELIEVGGTKVVEEEAIADEEIEREMADAMQAVQLAPEMRAGFVQEGGEQVDNTEQSLLAVLEKDDKSEPLHEAFRHIHSFKGNCGFMGFSDLERLSHRMETTLDGMREGDITPAEKNITVLLGMLDVLREAVSSIESGEHGAIETCDEHLSKLDEMMGQISKIDTVAPGAPVTAAEATEAAEAAAGIPAPEKETAVTKATDRAKKASRQDIRVDLQKLDSLINLVGELVIAESMVTRCPAISHIDDEDFYRATHQLRRICENLKDVAMAVRMIPLAATFRKMIRLVHDLSQRAGKKIKLNLVGEDTEVDKTVIEQIADPLVHIVRNSCDHGIGTPEERLAMGKPEMGTVTLEGRHEGGEVWIIIQDDGKGLDRDRILQKGIERGLVQGDGKDWSDERVFRLVFEPGFSTAAQVTDISGRGVGMDVVRRNIEKLNGRIDVKSELGVGTTFTLRIPLTLAIIDGMLVRVGSQKYMIPTLSIRESLQPEEAHITVTPQGDEVLRLRDEFMPVVRLHGIFNRDCDNENLSEGILVVAEDGCQSVAIFVDELLGQQQTVIKGLSEYLGTSEWLAGCTILGDGSVCLILDIGTMVEMTNSESQMPEEAHLES